LQHVERAGGKILDNNDNILIIELSGGHDEIEEVIAALGADIFKEVARSGQVLISRKTI